MNLQDLNLDIRTAVVTATVLFFIFALLSIWQGVRTIQASRKIRFYRLRQKGMVRGWRLVFVAFLFLILGFVTTNYAEPVAYSYFPPTATSTLTPTITLTPTTSLTPTVSPTPTITETPSQTNTPTLTPTPAFPLAVEALFESTLEPNPNSIFSDFSFTNEGLDENFFPINASTVFTNPVGHMYAVFSYDQLIDGVQWSALWYWEGELVRYETFPWDGGTGGIGYTDWNPPAEEWLSGQYTVYMYLYLDLFQTGTFTVVGDPPTPEPSLTPTITPTPTTTPSPIPTITLTPTFGPSPTRTPFPTLTRTLTNTPAPTPTPTFTYTPKPTWPPTITPSPTKTQWPSATPLTPSPTLTRWPTITNTPLP